jgi:RNA polymerase sigma factor (sigma-70 family)
MAQVDHLSPVEDEADAPSREGGQGQEAQPPFEEVYRCHSPDIYRYCLARLADPAAAEDATATTFHKAFVAYSRVRPEPSSIRLWLFRIAGNVVKDHHRRLWRGQRLLTTLAGAVRGGQDPEGQVLVRAELQEILDALAHLPPRDRQLVGLRAGAGLPFSDIAELMTMNENSARVATRRALHRLRAAVEDPK